VMQSSRPTTKLSQAWAAWNASASAADASSPEATSSEATSPESSAEATPTLIDPQVNPVDPSPAPEAEPVAVAAGGIESTAEAAPEASAVPESVPEPASQSSSSFGGMSWLRRDKGNDQKS
jgi:hypothetical protein